MRLIDADALEKEFCHGCKYENNKYVNCIDCAVANAPTVDAVSVVRCGECSHSEVCKMDDGDVRYCHIYEMQTEDEYYCADGERKDDE